MPPPPEIEPFRFPKKVVVTPAVVFISNIPLLRRFPVDAVEAAPPIRSVCVSRVPLPALKVPLAATVTFPITVRVESGVAIYCSIPLVPWPTVKLLQVAEVTSMVTVCPLAMVTLSVAVGTPAGVHVAALLQLPVAAEVLTLSKFLIAAGK